MAFIPFPTTVMVELFLTQDSQQLENTLYFDIGVTPTVAHLEVLTDEIKNWWIANVAPLCSNTVNLRGVKATSLASATAPALEIATAGPGGLAQPALPNSVTIAIKFLTAGRGRSSRGRNYIVGMIEDHVTANLVASSLTTSYVSAYEELLDTLVITVGTWVVASRFTNNAPRPVGVIAPVTSVAFTDRIVDSQRRRLPSRGN